jgi:hypothetical protein
MIDIKEKAATLLMLYPGSVYGKIGTNKENVMLESRTINKSIYFIFYGEKLAYTFECMRGYSKIGDKIIKIHTVNDETYYFDDNLNLLATIDISHNKHTIGAKDRYTLLLLYSNNEKVEEIKCDELEFDKWCIALREHDTHVTKIIDNKLNIVYSGESTENLNPIITSKTETIYSWSKTNIYNVRALGYNCIAGVVSGNDIVIVNKGEVIDKIHAPELTLSSRDKYIKTIDVDGMEEPVTIVNTKKTFVYVGKEKLNYDFIPMESFENRYKCKSHIKGNTLIMREYNKILNNYNRYLVIDLKKKEIIKDYYLKEAVTKLNIGTLKGTNFIITYNYYAGRNREIDIEKYGTDEEKELTGIYVDVITNEGIIDYKEFMKNRKKS